MKILIIGGTGTISSPITKLLSQDQNIELHVLNRGNKELPTGAIQQIGDFNDKEVMEKLALNNYDVVINFLVFTPDQAKQEIEVFTDKVKQYIFISTCATYNHDTAVVIDESHSQYNQHSRYGQAKAACEKLYLESKLPVTIVRPSQTYNGDRIPLSIKGKGCYSVIDRILNDKPVIIHGDGKSTWQATHSEDFARAFVSLIGQEKSIGEAYHIINEEIVNWDIIYNYLYELLDKKPNIIHLPTDLLAGSKTYPLYETIKGDKQYSVVYNSNKIREFAPDFKFEISIQKGLNNYLEYLEKNPNKKIVDDDFNEWCDSLINKYTLLFDSIKNSY